MKAAAQIGLGIALSMAASAIGVAAFINSGVYDIGVISLLHFARLALSGSDEGATVHGSIWLAQYFTLRSAPQ